MPLDFDKVTYQIAAMSDASPLSRVLEHFGGNQRQFADAVGLTQPAISQALKAGRAGPKLARRIERATGGLFKRHELRPDIWDAPGDGVAA